MGDAYFDGACLQFDAHCTSVMLALILYIKVLVRLTGNCVCIIVTVE